MAAEALMLHPPEISGGVRATTLPNACRGLPICLEAVAADLRGDPMAVAGWVVANRAALDRLSNAAGAILFRGFALPDAAAFDAFMTSYPAFEPGYSGGTSTRSVVTGRVMESTVAPPERVIPIHQEMAYSVRYPMKIAFYCELAPQLRGETPICDMRALDRLIPRYFYDRIKKRGLMYNRFFRSKDWQTGEPLLDVAHRTWQDALGTEDPQEAEREVKRLGSTFKWISNGIVISNLNPGFATHPDVGDSIWFNQIASLSLSPETIGSKMAALFEKHYGNQHPRPYWVSYGDQEPIGFNDISPLYPITDRVTATIPWRQGDVMLLDNIYVGHGRNTYVGERKIRVALVGSKSAAAQRME